MYLSELFGHSALKTSEVALLEISREVKNKFDVSRLRDHRGFYGIEVEVENISTLQGISKSFWSSKEDGSLRNHGIEFVTKPLRSLNLIYAVENMSDYLTKSNPKHDFSDRCSIHIHMNARRMTLEQIYVFIKLYLIFERTLYRIVGGDRDKNPFCVPVLDSYLEELLIQAESKAMGSPPDLKLYFQCLATYWKKYTGMNLLPMTQLGTIEFRAMPGGFNKDIIYNWLNIIGSLKKAACNMSPDVIRERIDNLNTDSKYMLFARMIFGNIAENFGRDVLNNLSSDMEEGIVFVKEIIALSNPELFKNTKEQFESSALCNKMLEMQLISIPKNTSFAEARYNRLGIADNEPQLRRLDVRIEFDDIPYEEAR